MNDVTSDQMVFFFRSVWRLIQDNAAIEAHDLMQEVIESGLASWKPATAKQAEDDPYGLIHKGEPILTLTPHAQAAIATVAEMVGD